MDELDEWIDTNPTNRDAVADRLTSLEMESILR